MSGTPHVLMIFLDGVGIGKKNPAINPFFSSRLTTLQSLLGGNIPYLRNCHYSGNHVTLKPINATLGVPGLPQSGTGQTALLTGVNASKFIGKHFGPYPYSTLKPVIEEKNIFKVLSTAHKKTLYANAFPPKYFEYINSTKTRTTAISYSWLSSGFALNTHETLAHGKALSSDITSEKWNKLGFPSVPELSLQDAGKRLIELTNKHHFVLFEYYYTDHAGHSQSMETSRQVLEAIDGMLEGVVQHLDPKKHLLLLTSDHGNIEDLSTKSHTRNPVPLLLMGKGHTHMASKIKNLTHVTPAILNVLLS